MPTREANSCSDRDFARRLARCFGTKIPGSAFWKIVGRSGAPGTLPTARAMAILELRPVAAPTLSSVCRGGGEVYGWGRPWGIALGAGKYPFVVRSQRAAEAGMRTFAGKLAVITGGGSGMGRELVCQLVAQHCNVAMCDVSAPGMAQTRELCDQQGVPQGIRLSAHLADVSDKSQVLGFRDAIVRDYGVDKLDLLFNNAGIGGGGSLFSNSRAQWEKTFNICWGGVYFCTRAFLPMLVRADEAHIVNTSSVNGFWASLGPNVPHTAYCAAKFAVKGFSEALIADLRVNAPHVKCSVVMPGHIGTSIVSNSRRVQYATDSDSMGAEEIAEMRVRLAASGRDLSQVSDADLQTLSLERARQFLENAPTTAATAATIILDGIKAGRWRILVGEDAHELDAMVRQAPENAYEPAFFEDFVAKSGWHVGR